MDLLNLSQPWDCQRFPKSKTICYGGGGGGGGNPVKAVTKAVSDNTPTIKVEAPPPIKVDPPKLPKSTQDLVKGASTTIESVKKDVGSGIEKKKSLITGGVEQVKKEGSKIIEDTKTQVGTETEKLKKGEFNLGDAVSGTTGGVKKTFQESDVATGDIGKTTNIVKENIEKAEKAVATSDLGKSDIGKATSAGIENVKKEGVKATNQIKQETNKLGKGDFSLKKAVQGTASGAAKTFKESDAGKVVEKIAKETGYTGSDFDKGMQKIEKEASNVVNQTLDFIDSPEKVIKKGVKRASDFVETVKGDLTDTANAYSKSLQSIGEAGENIGKAATDTFQTGMNAAGALGTNLANQLNTAFGDQGGLKGESENQNQLGNRSNITDLLKQKRRARRGGLSRSGTSRTLITGKV